MRRLAALAALLALPLVGCPGDPPPPVTPPPPSDGGKTAPGTTAPAAPAAPPKPFDRATARTPWRLCKVGDWATYHIEKARVKQVRFEVTAVTERSVTFIRKNAETGATLDEPIVLDLADEESRYKDPMTYDALAQDDKGQPIAPAHQKATVAGKEVDVLVVKRAARGSTTELWLAEDTVRPFNQCAVKSIRDGKVELELVDFGSAP